MRLQHLTPNADLSESAVEEAVRRCYEKAEKKTLVVCAKDLVIGEKLARQFNLTLEFDPDLPPDSWYVEGKWNGIFSVGP